MKRFQKILNFCADVKHSSRPNNRKAERGNVLVYILIAIILFAALSYTVGNMMRGGNSDMISEENASLYAGEILNYGRVMRQAIHDMKISNGCTDEEIRFIDSEIAGYGTSVRSACDLFDPSGGNVNYISPNQDVLASISPAPTLYGEWYFAARVCAIGVGTPDIGCTASGFDIIAFLPYINLPTCLAINDALGIDNPGGAPPVESGNAWTAAQIKFTGDFSSAGIHLERDRAMAGCFSGFGALTTPPEGTYHFFQVLVAR